MKIEFTEDIEPKDIIAFLPIYMTQMIDYVCKSISFDFPRNHIGVLAFVLKFGPMPISQIADYFLIQKPNMTQIIDDLCHNGLVERNVSKNDRRVVNIVLTEKGTEISQKIAFEMDEIFNNMISLLSEEEKSMFLDAHKILFKYGNKIFGDKRIKNVLSR